MERCNHRIITGLSAVAAFMLVAARFTLAAEIDGRVVGVTDGDTIVVRDSAKIRHIVRLAAIDAPESSQPFGRRSKQDLSQMIFAKSVAIAFKRRDRWGRIVGNVFFGGKDVNLKQVIDGCAWYNPRYRYEQAVAERPLYEAAEKAARAAHRGLWADRNPVPPWKWRRVKHGSAIADSKFVNKLGVP
jgi:endonuclease YncB( thermonuclease family)